MRIAYALLGLTFLIVFAGAYVLTSQVAAPTRPNDEQRSSYESNENGMLTLTSPAFSEGESIPSRFTCEGENVNPELRIDGVPEGAQSLALLMDDPDIPDRVKENMGIEVFDHWVVFNIPADARVIEEGEAPPGVEGMNSAGQGYTGPCPPDREHRYFFKVYALDTMLELNKSATKADVEAAMKGHVLEKTQLMGVYEKGNK